MEFCRDSCKETKELSSDLGPPTERIPQPLPDPENPGHYMDVSDSPTHDENGERRTPDDYLPRKCLKDLYGKKAISQENPDSIKAFSAKFCVEEKLVIDYLSHLQDIDHRKGIRTRTAQELKRKQQQISYTDFLPWNELVEDGKLEKLRVRELDMAT